METPEQFKLRLPRSLKSRLSASALEHRRSLNAEIIVLLERAMPAENEKAETAATVSA
ncbi:Arc family DNA-binding protein [Rhizobium ruizarguesonis]|jgi:predicted HicB family RNase H-like nuclease|uniref:Arc family DNA-binding protein n=1 Tax=Rhizobium TaxID=379 RepID=UPI00103225D5|nr:MULTISPECIES: Arc family DNA-binding protein [Rhizobium]MBY3312221.1 Arc family DNA-binding protein [Rhizobium laguerreae]TBB56838.1 Arc family DNA-binding protein [Rhizobium ruizarguesonis]